MSRFLWFSVYIKIAVKQQKNTGW